MNDENARYSQLIAADIDALNVLISNRRSHAEAERALLEEDERRLAELTALLEHVKGAE